MLCYSLGQSVVFYFSFFCFKFLRLITLLRNVCEQNCCHSRMIDIPDINPSIDADVVYTFGCDVLVGKLDVYKVALCIYVPH